MSVKSWRTRVSVTATFQQALPPVHVAVVDTELKQIIKHMATLL